MTSGDPESGGTCTKLTIAYEGTGFAGWAIQPGLRTVEGELTRALGIVRRQPTTISVAGRTDRGVHAEAQVASHGGEPASARSLNGVLPADISVRRSEPAPPGFDARRDATSRAYRYSIDIGPTRPVLERRTVLWHPRPLDPDLLDACAALLPGRRDLSAFTPLQNTHVHFQREILHAEWVRTGTRLDFLVEADAFLRASVRTLVGTMIEVAAGSREPGSFEALLSGGTRLDAGDTARAHGLCLIGAGYGERVLTPSGHL